MDTVTYCNIVDVIRSHRGLSKDCLEELEEQFKSVSHDTLYSILCLEYQKRMRTNHVKNQSTINKYWGLYQQGLKNGENPGIIVRIAVQFQLAPCLVARLILQKYFENTQNEQVQVNVYVRDTTLIPHMGLAYEIFLCTIYDNLYSPLSDTLKSSLGQQYEIKLNHEVVKLGLAFNDEEQLRRYGYDKTPDVKLDVPVAIDGFIINWIESKALFADEDIHSEYTKNQYLSYWNRFGSGLVIYWFGYIKSIVEVPDKRFIIRDHLPTNVIKLNSLYENS